MENSTPKVVQNWANSIQKRNPKLMTSLYSQNAILIPTLDSIKAGQNKIYGYFENFLKKKNLTCKIIKNESIELGNGNVVHNGYYSFDFINENGYADNVLGRYTFITNSNGEIITHHSSEQPIN
jgi:hypothetical protein